MTEKHPFYVLWKNALEETVNVFKERGTEWEKQSENGAKWKEKEKGNMSG